ncbi:MAG TPA: beta-galactosidase [Solirubrobacterales bacterium]|nr:beta-galactosidase [Solirubrobacterales bacterium]
MIRGRWSSGRIASPVARAGEAVCARASWRQLRGLVALVGVLSLTALPSAAPAEAAPKEFFGVVPQNSVTSSDAQRMARGGVGVVRFPLKWEPVEPTDDEFDFGALDRLIGTLAANGIRPLPIVSGVPAYVDHDPLALPLDSSADKSQWQEFLRAVVNRYGEGGSYWTTAYPTQYPGAEALPLRTVQIWNEQNGPKHAHYPNPGLYAELVKISHTAIASEDPSIEVLLGGMFGTPTGEGGIDAWDFLDAVYRSGAKESFDAIAVHPYSPDIKGIKQQVNTMRKVIARYADAAAKKKFKKAKKSLKRAKKRGSKAKVRKAKKRVKKARRGLQTADIWVTEIGWGSEGASTSRLVKGLEGQARLLRKSFQLFEKKRKKWRISGVLWYTWRDRSAFGAPCDWCASAGLFRQDNVTAKPAFNEYVRLTGGS